MVQSTLEAWAEEHSIKERVHKANSYCDCRNQYAELLKRQALARKTAQKLLKKGGHPFLHRDQR